MEYLQRIQSIGTDLVALIDDSLDLARVEAGEVDVVVEPVSVERLVADVLAKIEGTDHVQKLTLRTVIPSNTAPVMADSHRLQQVLLNLVANAVKFTEQGDVTVRVATDGLTPTRIEVEDQGIGIPKDQLESIFEPFQQADDTMWRRFGGYRAGADHLPVTMLRDGFRADRDQCARTRFDLHHRPDGRRNEPTALGATRRHFCSRIVRLNPVDCGRWRRHSPTTATCTPAPPCAAMGVSSNLVSRSRNVTARPAASPMAAPKTTSLR